MDADFDRDAERRSYKAQWKRDQNAQKADIDQITPVANPVRRRACLDCLHLFLQVYFPDSTGLTPFSDDHVRMIDRLENCLIHGGRNLNAVYRGFSKTTITENAALWATLKGLRRFVAIYAADQPSANGMVESISKELCENELLLADFPEICEPFAALKGKPQRCRAQTFNGKPTHIRMAKEYLVFPTVRIAGPDGKPHIPPACGAIIRAKGLTSASRGMSYKRPDGAKVRPDFALIDDFQTDESARQPGQVTVRLNIIRKAILKSAGHRKSIACAINATVIEQDDGVDQLLDPERNPSWDGMRVKMVRKWADAHDTLWEDYRRIRHNFDRSVPADKQRAESEATEFYSKHRKAMDAGCVVSWKSCYDPEIELSAIQHAYNLFLDDPPEVFASECQNEPLKAASDGIEIRPAGEIVQHVNGFKRGQVPNEAAHLTAFCDVHDDVLYWMVCAWKEDFTGYLVDYGTYPEQSGGYFTKSQATRTLKRAKPGVGTEAAIVAGLEKVINQLCGREWVRIDGTPARIAKMHIDSGHKPDQVELACRRSEHAAILEPQRGIAVGPGETPIAERPRKKCYRLGDNWYEPKSSRRDLRHVRADVNHWKVFFHTRLAIAIGDPGSFTLYSPGKRERDHRMLADHFTSEVPTHTEGKGRVVITWKNPPNKDNHWFDCAIGCMVAASMLGVTVEGAVPVQRRSRGRRPTVKLSNLRNS